ncbi:DUF2635 domain-containing protein [Acetobacter estunensis]|nr:DUF2635 domain-containing protein [Acetobacter estunensis]MBV1836085.1 DUF2635 domain-containing protein [Acetobacter estunensis]
MRVKPAEGRAVRWPDSRRLLATDGENVPETDFWRRRLRSGDVVKVADAAPQLPPATEETHAE